MSEHLDINGKVSTKRAWARRLLWTALAMVWIYSLLWAYSIFKEIVAPDMPTALLQMWFGLAGGGLTAIGLTLGETKHPKNDENG